MMKFINNSHWIILPALTLICIVLLYRAFHHRNEEKSSLIVMLGLGGILFFSTIVVTLLLSHNIWFHVLVVGLFNNALCVLYIAIYRVLNSNKPRVKFVDTFVFRVVFLLSIVAIVFDFIRIYIWTLDFPNMDMPSFNYSYYYSEYALRRADILLVRQSYWITSVIFFVFYNIVPSFILFSIVLIYIRTWKQPSDKAYKLRRIICATGFFIGAVGALVSASTPVWWLFDHHNLRVKTASLYQSTKIIMVYTVVFGFLIRHIWIDKPINYLSKLYKIIKSYKKDNFDHITYLHQKMIKIVPLAALSIDDWQKPVNQLSNEISDARLMIFSHYQHSIIDSYKEAQIIMQLTNNRTIIDEPGEYFPPRIEGDITKYNLNVTKSLCKLENTNIN